MLTQQQIADHLGIRRQAVSIDLKKMGITNYQDMTLEEVRLMYLARLRGQAAGHVGQKNKITLVDARINKEVKEAELLDIKIAKEREEVVDMEQLLPVMQSIWQGCKTKIIGRANKLKTKLDALYGIDIDIELLEEEDEGLLDDLSGYVSSYRQTLDRVGRSVEKAKKDNNN